jgi:hypothetical protein
MEQFDEERHTLYRISQPSNVQIFMGMVPALLVFISSLVMMWYAYDVKDVPEWRTTSPIVSTILSFEMLIMCGLIIAYDHHEQYELLPSMYEIIARINVFHLLICSCFIMYVKMGDDNYTTYLTWLYVLTIPIMILSVCPFTRNL